MQPYVVSFVIAISTRNMQSMSHKYAHYAVVICLEMVEIVIRGVLIANFYPHRVGRKIEQYQLTKIPWTDQW